MKKKIESTLEIEKLSSVELSSVELSPEELSPEELEQVAGGEVGAVSQAAASGWRGIVGNSAAEYGSLYANFKYN